MNIQWPFVWRERFDYLDKLYTERENVLAQERSDSAKLIVELHERTALAEQLTERVSELETRDLLSDQAVRSAEQRASAAETRAQAAEERCIKVFAEARVTMTDAFALARDVSRTLFAQDVGDIDPPRSVGENDRAAAERARAEREEAKERRR